MRPVEQKSESFEESRSLRPLVVYRDDGVDSSHRPGELSNGRLGKYEEPAALIGPWPHLWSGCSRHVADIDTSCRKMQELLLY